MLENIFRGSPSGLHSDDRGGQEREAVGGGEGQEGRPGEHEGEG